VFETTRALHDDSVAWSVSVVVEGKELVTFLAIMLRHIRRFVWFLELNSFFLAP
jgi:hypothetical protein